MEMQQKQATDYSGEFRERNLILIEQPGLERLAGAHVALFGLGGVGGACAVDLVRSGVGRLSVMDFDTVAASNLNRLAYATLDDVGIPKPKAFTAFASRINPQIQIEYMQGMMGAASTMADIPQADFYIDAIDTLNAKVCLLCLLLEMGKPFIASTGMGGRLDPLQLSIGDFWQVQGDPLGFEVRNRLRRRGMQQPFPCIWSREAPLAPQEPSTAEVALHEQRRTRYAETGEGLPPGRIRRKQGTMPFVPQAAGHALASYAVRKLLAMG